MSEKDRELVLKKIEEEFGLEGKHVVRVLYDSEELLTVEEIEKQLEEVTMEFEVKDIRKILYNLSDAGYARSRRYRNNETGWISYLWNLFPDKILEA